MGRLSFKTRGMANPKGKQNIYFFCHPAEFEKYFELIAQEILSKFDCAIWYDSMQEAYEKEELLEELQEMQLFVVPITRRFLYEKNRGLDIEFTFAKEKNIPILPILFDHNIMEDFNLKCGELQFLDYNETDHTVESFEVKLEKFLSSVLIGEELAEKIRAAFDAYVFLSYRKKDRKYAQQLMRLIHENKYYRDIAIWYDEFLVAGENFNEAIEAALQKSDYFAMVVTPNLVNEENYVTKKEYPLARSQSKPILPVEMKSTDRERLYEIFTDIPECIDAKDTQALNHALVDWLNDVAIKENDNTPEHLFFIGLAYLNGIDVEVNETKALELITIAANDGLDEAMDKLVSMYSFGKAVKKDFSIAVYWKNKLVEKYKTIYENGETDVLAVLLHHMLGLGDLYKSQGMYEKAKDCGCQSIEWLKETPFEKKEQYIRSVIIYEFLISVAERMENETLLRTYCGEAFQSMQELTKMGSSFAYAEESINVFLKMGQAQLRLGELEKARGCFSAYIKMLDEKKRVTKDDMLLWEYFQVYWNMARIAFDEGNMEEAKEWFEKHLAAKERYWEIKTAKCNHLELISSYVDISRIYLENGDLEEGYSYLERAEERWNHNVQEENITVEQAEEFFYLKRAIGEFHRECGAYQKTMEQFEQMVQIAKNQVEKAENSYSVIMLAEAYGLLGDAYRWQNQIEKAKEYYETALCVLQEKEAVCIHVEWLKQISACYRNLETIYSLSKIEDKKMAKEYYKKAMKIREDLLEDFYTIGNMEALFGIYNAYADGCWMEHQIDEAEEYAQKSLELAEKMISKKSNTKYKRMLASANESMGRSYHNTDVDKAITYYEKSLELVSGILEKSESIQDKLDAYRICVGIGFAYSSKGQNKEKIEYFEKALRYVEDCEHMPDLKNQHQDIYRMSILLATEYLAEKRYRESKKYYQKAIAFGIELMERNELEDGESMIQTINNALFNVCLSLGDFEDSFEYIKYTTKKKIEKSELLVKETNTIDARREWADNNMNLGSIYATEGDYKTAYEYFKTGVEIAEMIPKEDLTPEIRKELFSYYL